MKHIIDIEGYYVGFGGPNTQLQQGQTEVPFAPPLDIIKARWVNNEWIESATEEEIAEANTPLEVALWKVRAVLTVMGLETSVTQALSNLPEPNRTAALAIWDRGNTVDRFSPTVMFLQNVLGLSDFQVNNIFIEADKIVL
jgi:hypothetical protein